MTKRFKSFADSLDETKSVSNSDFDAYREKMKKIMQDARRNHARAVQSAKEVFIGR